MIQKGLARSIRSRVVMEGAKVKPVSEPHLQEEVPHPLHKAECGHRLATLLPCPGFFRGVGQWLCVPVFRLVCLFQTTVFYLFIGCRGENLKKNYGLRRGRSVKRQFRRGVRRRSFSFLTFCR